MDLKEVGLLNTDTHWYFLSKFDVIWNSVNRHVSQDLRILDFGAGDGFFSKQLLKRRSGTANCVDINYTTEKEEDSICFSKKIVMTKPNLILLIDVLEHVPDPVYELQKLLENIESPCTIVISVPAFQSLWSVHDEFLGHYGRYRLEQVEKWLDEVIGNVKIVKRHYLYSIIFPLVFLYRKLRKTRRSDLTEVSSFVNSILYRISQFDNRFVRNRFFGLSAFFVILYTPKSSTDTIK